MTVDPLEIIDRYRQMQGERSNFESQWQDCADYALPNNNQITTKKAQGEPRVDKFQTVGENSVVMLSAGLYSYMFPTDSKAFVLRIDQEDLKDNDEVKQWLSKTTDALHTHMIQSNFREAFFENLKAMCCFGTSSFYCERGRHSIIDFSNLYMADIYVDVDSKGNIDTVYRRIKYTARQAVQEFGIDNVGEKIKAAFDDPKRKNVDKFEFCHAIYYRTETEYDPDSQDPLLMHVASVYVLVDEKVLIKESGYPEFPVQTPRFDRNSDETYGRSPTMKMLPDIKMAGHMQQVRIKAWEKMCDPPIVLPDDGSIWPLATKVGGVIHMQPGSEPPFWFEFKGDITTLNDAIDRVYQNIKEGYFLTLFEMPEQNIQMTATEVIQRTESKMRILTPIIGRLQAELFNPMIHRMMGVLGRAGGLPKKPDILENVDYRIEYLGSLALAMKTLESQGFVKTMEELKLSFGELGILSYMDNFPVDEISRGLAANNGVPATWLKDLDVMNEQRQVRAEQEAKQAQMEQLPAMAKAMKDAGTKPEKGSPAEGMFGNAA